MYYLVQLNERPGLARTISKGTLAVFGSYATLFTVSGGTGQDGIDNVFILGVPLGGLSSSDGFSAGGGESMQGMSSDGPDA